MNVLIFSKEALWYGGVVNFIETLKKNLADGIHADQFLLGRRKNGPGSRLSFLVPVFDAFRLLGVMITRKYDVYHLNPSLNFKSLARDMFYLFLVRLFTSNRIVVSFHGWEQNMQDRIDRSRLLKTVFRHVLDKADCILVLARPFSDWLAEIGIPAHKIRLFTTMFDGETLGTTDSANTGETIRLLFLSRFVREKGIYELLEAFERLSKKYNHVTLDFAGSGSEERNMRAWVEAHGLGGKVRFLGYVRDAGKSAVLQQSDIFVFPTYYGEGCPVSLLEAMAAGLGVVTTPVGGIPDIITSGDNGILIDGPVRSENVYVALDNLLSRPEALAAMRFRAKKDAWSRYEASIVTRNIESIYHGRQ